MKKNVFFFPVWGENYINIFNKFALRCLYNNIKNVDPKILSMSKIEIWTFEKDIKKIKNLKLIKKIKKKININYEIIDYVYLDIKKNSNLNKYQLLSVIQKIFINSHSYNYDYLWFIYPDFIFSDTLIKKYLSLKKKYDAYFIPVPQLIEENIIDKFNKKLLDMNTNIITNLIFENLHPIVKICDVRKSKTNTPSLFLALNKNLLVFKYFHMHPLIIKTDISNIEINDKIYPSLDEGLVSGINEKKIFIPKNNYFAVCASLLKKNEYMLPNEKYSLKKTYRWCLNHVNKTHINISKHFYFIKKNKKIPNDLNLKNIIDNRLNKILKKISKKIKTSDKLYPSINIPLLNQNEKIYEVIRANHFRSYLKYNSNELKKIIRSTHNKKYENFLWFKQLYLKNL